MHVDGVEPLHFHLDEMRILVSASDDVPAFHPVFPVYDAQEWREDTINDNDMLSYSLTTMMCFLTKE